MLTTEEADTRLYVIRRPGWVGTAQELAAAGSLKRVGDEEVRGRPLDPLVRRPRGIRRTRDLLHLRGVEHREDPRARERAGIPATDIFEVADTVVIRPDPVALAV